MVPSISVSLVTLMGHLACVSPVSSKTVHNSKSIIRSDAFRKSDEDDHNSVRTEILPGGAVLEQARSSPSNWVDEDGSGTESELMCDFDFPMGAEDACECKEEESSVILKEDKCIEAANRYGLPMPRNWKLESEWFDFHPKGCFRDACTDNRDAMCIFFNPSEKRPARCDKDRNFTDALLKSYHKVGTPVCNRVRFQNGTTHDEEEHGPQEHGGCAKNYGVVMHEATCLEAATCLGYCSVADFRVTIHNASQHDYYPNGCFVDKASGCVMFNDPSALAGKLPEHPGRYGGTEICEVEGHIKGMTGGPSHPHLGGTPGHPGTGHLVGSTAGHPLAAARAAFILSASGESADVAAVDEEDAVADKGSAKIAVAKSEAEATAEKDAKRHRQEKDVKDKGN